MNAKKKKVLSLSLFVAAILVLLGTYAWFTSTDNVTNKFKTGALPDGSVTIVEDFEEPEEWKPAQAVKKEVGVLSNSESDVVIRLSFKETLQKMEADGNKLKQYSFDAEETDTDYVPVPSVDFANNGYKSPSELGLQVEGLPTGLTLVGKEVFTNKYEFALYRKVGDKCYRNSADFAYDATAKKVTITNVKYLYYKLGSSATKDWAVTPFPTTANAVKSAVDEKILLGYASTVNLTTPTAGSWTYDPAGGWFYYIGKLGPGERSPLILSTVTLDGSADNTYQLMDYTLNVRIEALQATDEAIDGGGFSNIPPSIATAIKNAI